MSVIITQEELSPFKQLKEDFAKIIYSVGSISLQIADLDEKLRLLNKEKDNQLSTYKVLENREKSLSAEFSGKYGLGSLNLETGEFIPA